MLDGPRASSPAHAAAAPPGSPSPRWLSDAGWLLAAQVTLYALPVVTLPLLTRRLGAAAFADVAAALAWGQLIATLPVFGFTTTAPRTLAPIASAAERRLTVSSIAGARLVLTLAGVALVVATAPLVPDGVGRLWPGVAAYVAGQGIAWGWAFEGAARFRTSALLALASRVLVPLAVALAVHGPGDGARVLGAYAAASMVETVVGAVLAHRAGWLGRVRGADVGRALRGGATFFAGQALVTTYTAAGGLWLRMAGLPAADVGRYVAAESVARAAAALLQPLTRTFVPRLTIARGAARAAWERRSLHATLGAGLLLGLGLAAGRLLLPALLGDDFAASTGLVLLLTPLPIVVAASQAVGMQPFVADRRDRAVVAMLAAGSAVTIVGAFVVAPRAGVAGMATMVIAAEVAVLAVALGLRRMGR